MKKTLFLLFFILLTNFLYSQDCNLKIEKDDIVQIAEGYGETRAIALENAKRNAVDQAVGSYILTETQISDDEIEYDKINSFGKGLVRDYCEINSGIDGYEKMIKIKAVVAKEMVIETLKQSGYEIELNTKTMGDKLIQELKLELGETDGVRKIMEEIDPGDPFIYELKESGFGRFETKVGRQKSFDKTSGVIKLHIAVKPNFNNYLLTIEDALRNIAITSYKDDMVLSFNQKDMIYFPFEKDNDQTSSDWQANKLIFINEIKETNFESSKLSKFYKRDKVTKRGKVKEKSIKGKGAKEKFLKMFDGQNLHVNASIMAFEDPALVYEIKDKINKVIKEDYFKITIKKIESSEIVKEYYGSYNYYSGHMQFDGLRSDNKVPENRIKTDRPKFIKNEFQNNNNLLAQSLFYRNEFRYLSNSRGSYRKQLFISTASTIASAIPFVYSNNKYNSWQNSVQPYGFRKDYNPHQTLYDASIITSIAGVLIFGGWRWGLSNAPFTVLKANAKEDVTIFCSDIDYYKSAITINAEKQGLIDKDHEVFNWDLVKEENSNVLSVFYTEIPVGLDQMKQNLKKTISRITQEEYEQGMKRAGRNKNSYNRRW